jgi:hypothetical protein
MNDKIFEQLEKLSSAIGVGAEKVWGALVMQGWLEMGKHIFLIVLGAWGAYACLKALVRYAENDKPQEDGRFAVALIIATASVAVVVASFIKLQAPEAYAVSRILEVLK